MNNNLDVFVLLITFLKFVAKLKTCKNVDRAITETLLDLLFSWWYVYRFTHP